MNESPWCQKPDACTASKNAAHCRACSLIKMNTDPEIKAKRTAGIKARFNDPVYAEEHRQRIIAHANSPEGLEHRRRHGRHIAATVLCRPDVRAKIYAPDACARRGRAIAAVKLSWCPIEYRDQYKHLVRFNHVKAVDARKMIEELIKADRARYLKTGQLPVASRAAGA